MSDNTTPSWTFTEGEPIKTEPVVAIEEAAPVETTAVIEPVPEPEPVVEEPKPKRKTVKKDEGWWGWVAGGIAAVAGILGTAAVVLRNTKVKPVGPSSEEEAKPTVHTAKEEMTPGEITRWQLDNRERD